MSDINDGGPAFPSIAPEFTGISSDGEELYENGPTGGMTLRDYFAVHSTQPGCSEICALKGLRYSGGFVWKDEHTRLAVFDDWLATLPLDERLLLCAQVRYAEADAMLKARTA